MDRVSSARVGLVAAMTSSWTLLGIHAYNNTLEGWSRPSARLWAVVLVVVACFQWFTLAIPSGARWSGSVTKFTIAWLLIWGGGLLWQVLSTRFEPGLGSLLPIPTTILASCVLRYRSSAT